MKPRPIFVALALLALLTGAAIAQQPLSVQMPHSDRVNLVTPRAVAALTGVEGIETRAIALPAGELVLAGYSIEIDSQPCRVTQVTPEMITFVVSEAVRPGARVLYIQGPLLSRFLDVQVERFWPVLWQQEGEVVAESLARLFPEVYLGTPIPVSPTSYNFISLRASGFVTGWAPTQWPFAPVVVLERDQERYEIAAEVYEVPGFPGSERVTFWAPPCANGAYHVSVVYAGYVTYPGVIRFVSDCSISRAQRSLPR